MRYAMAIDTKKCVGCSDCVVACQIENHVPTGFCRDWVIEATSGTYPDLSMEFRSERCNHCSNAPCVRCCPTEASHIVEGGIVLVDADQCIGCGACIESCPYDARYIHPEGHVDKCTFCIHRVEKGQNPACVDVCPTTCMYFGDTDDPNSDISKLLKKRKWKTLIPEAGTDPNIYYLI
ncbi:MAG: 4Fe-4S dicluster domain-containing protein [Candidatus Marinimicrobia bacterium]|jgi:Fe-S-cluster-containing dehydrogenase component|nr:4Fe-4S dicluster domain-containing protein [Candidatus Neomarinimicrobiota bacterium]MBT3502200.1 4Fe-4S dicluster domain-containing protein [Candidatus Neomarinimicrobiota bacterium]MBT3839623.1 4Fe-4S dicluster domain-containing protein [Candidatus Neomarinimicrobiota bacterium]MBT3998351.1 4Fe-4S dicluster domain-containing protein [Candidatus Neomarinimicrobiota bacterium]MBT4282448.1 4Fe-4S dicluster domain-containing protein [Candidatus Neomarinimicrobiota bacterium]